MAAIGAGVVRVLAGVIAFALGAAAGLLGAFVQSGVVVAAGIAWPLGLFLALGLEIGALLLAAGVADRAGVWLAGSGWVLTVLVLTWPRAAGDVVVPGTWYGYVFLGGGMLVAVIGAFTITVRRLAHESAMPSDAARERR